MRYVLGIGVLFEYPELPIEKERFLELKKSKEVLFNALAIEEKYEILISNYLELERKTLDLTTFCMVRNSIDYSDFFDIELALNIRLVNLLTAARLYVDQLHRHVRSCLPAQENIKESIKSLFDSKYEQNPEYRFMEALRNYVQHRGLPVHGAVINQGWTDLGEGGLLEFSLDVISQKSNLEEDGCFKKRVLDEIPDKVDLKFATRSYIESISEVQESARQMIKESVDHSRNVREAAIEEYRKSSDANSASLRAYCYDGEDLIEEVPLLLKWDDIRMKLEKRNAKLVNLRKRYATGQAKPPKK